MDLVLRHHRAYGAVYIDDIIIILTTMDEHVQHMTAVLVEKRKAFCEVENVQFCSEVTGVLWFHCF